MISVSSLVLSILECKKERKHKNLAISRAHDRHQEYQIKNPCSVAVSTLRKVSIDAPCLTKTSAAKSWVETPIILIPVFTQCSARVVVMSVANVLFLPVYMGRYYANAEAVMPVLGLIAAFNAAQGAISIVGSFFIYEAIVRRIPSLRH